MIVCQLTENVTKEELHKMFPDALDVVLPRNRIASHQTEKFNSKGFVRAYRLYWGFVTSFLKEKVKEYANIFIKYVWIEL